MAGSFVFDQSFGAGGEIHEIGADLPDDLHPAQTWYDSRSRLLLCEFVSPEGWPAEGSLLIKVFDVDGREYEFLGWPIPQPVGALIRVASIVPGWSVGEYLVVRHDAPVVGRLDQVQPSTVALSSWFPFQSKTIDRGVLWSAQLAFPTYTAIHEHFDRFEVLVVQALRQAILDMRKPKDAPGAGTVLDGPRGLAGVQWADAGPEGFDDDCALVFDDEQANLYVQFGLNGASTAHAVPRGQAGFRHAERNTTCVLLASSDSLWSISTASTGLALDAPDGHEITDAAMVGNHVVATLRKIGDETAELLWLITDEDEDLLSPAGGISGRGYFDHIFGSRRTGSLILRHSNGAVVSASLPPDSLPSPISLNQGHVDVVRGAATRRLVADIGLGSDDDPSITAGRVIPRLLGEN